MQSLDSQNSAERIKLLVEREGKAARNLVTWSVPVVDSVESGKPARGVQHTGGGNGAGGGSHGNSRYTTVRRKGGRGKDLRRKSSGEGYLPLATQVTSESVSGVGGNAQTPLSQREEICRYYSSKTQRQLRSSKSPSRLNLHARYWSYLFDNLHRAVDEIYKTCEVDESIVECQEVIMTLEVCRKDFEALIRRIQLFEQSDLHTKSSNIAWEVRKTTSPGKPRGMGSHQATPSPPPPSPLQGPPTTRSLITPLAKSTSTPPVTATPPVSSTPSTVKSSATKVKPPKLPQLHNVSSDQPRDTKMAHLPSSSPTVSSSRSSSRPSSARSLDFGGCTKASRLSKTESVKKPIEGHDGNPTWADRVKGVSRGAGLTGGGKPQPTSSTSRKSEGQNGDAGGGKRTDEQNESESRKGKESSEINCSSEGKEQNGENGGGKESVSNENTSSVQSPPADPIEEEEGWEMVTRGRVKSGSGLHLSAKHMNRWSHPEHVDDITSLAKKAAVLSRTPEKEKAAVAEKQVKNEATADECKDGAATVGDGAVEEREEEGDVKGEKKEEGDVEGERKEEGDVKGERKEKGDVEGEGKEEGDKEREGDGDEEGEGKKEGDEDALNAKEEGVELNEEASSECIQEESAAMEESESQPGLESEPVTTQESEKEIQDTWTWDDTLAAYNASEAYRAEKSWADRCDSPPGGGLSEIPRSPGRAIHLHQRLSSPSRKRPMELEETRRIQEEKQAKAQLQRSKLQEEKTNKSRVEADKIREARESRDALARQRKEALEDKLQRAEMLRESHLQEIVRKAQEEEAKVSEISFINTLEAQNRKIEVEERYQGRKARLQELLDERQRKKDEQLAKEEAAQERRRTKEAERLAKVMELDQRRRDQEVKVEQMRLERDRAREEAAKEKAKERERKLLARNAALLTSSEELERKIQLKHDESSRRYDQQLEQRKKLAATGISSRHASADQPPRVEAYKTKKWCTICSVEIVSEVYLLSHLRGRKHQAAVALLSSSQSPLPSAPPPPPLVELEREGGGAVDDSVIVDASEEHQGPPGEHPELQERIQAGKKRARKLRQRMSNRVKEMENKSGGVVSTHSKNRSKLQKALRELNKQVDSFSSTRPHLPSSQLPQLDRALGDINRSLLTREDQLCFCQLGGVASVLKLLVVSVGEGGSAVSVDQWKLPLKTFSLGLTALHNSCVGHNANCRYLVTSNKAVPLIDLSLLVLVKALSTQQQSQKTGGVSGEEPSKAGTNGCSNSISIASLGGSMLKLLASMVSTLAPCCLEPEETTVSQQVTDIISYMVSVGLIDKLGEYFLSIMGPIEQTSITHLVHGGLNLLVATTAFLHCRVEDVFSGLAGDDPTLLTTLLQQTELMGLMQLLYAILLSGGPPRHSHSPPPLTTSTLAIAMATIKALNNSAILDLKMVQACLGAEGISLEFRHIVSYLLWYCSHYENRNLLHELILAVGYFCVLNHDNQVYLQSGRSPTLLQLLCGLPFEYFSNPKLSQLLYPTLIAACYQSEENKAILQEEISSKLLVVFLQDACSKAQARDKEEKKTSSMEKKMSEKKISSIVEFSSELQHRFPRIYWEKAIAYFSDSSLAS